MRVKPIQHFFVVFIWIAICLFLADRAEAQNSRAEEIAAKQAKKAENLRPYTPNRAEDFVMRVQNWGILSPLPRGPYPFFGSAYPGGGFALGAGYRRYITDTGFFDVHGAWSISNYRMLDFTFRLPDAGGGLIRSRLNAHYVHANKVTFFGIGNDSDEDDETSFLYNPTTIDFALGFYPGKYFSVGGDAALEKYEIGEGEKPNVPSIEEVFNPITAPGLGLDPEYFVAGLWARFDWRESPGYSTSGGLYNAEWRRYSERNDLHFDFERLDVEARQLIPILRANQILAFRALASFTDVEDVNDVPFFLLPKLGGGSELRGFRDFRFRDRHRMLLTAEYRWTPSKFIDLALFYETGKVASRTKDLDFSDLHDCYGFGIRFHTPAATPLRVDIAKSVEGIRFIISGGTSF